MNWMQVPSPARGKLLKMYEDGKDIYEAAAYLGMNPETLKRRLREHRQQEQFQRTVLDEGISIAPLHNNKYTEFPVLNTNDAMLTSDWELPDTDPVMMETMLLVAIKHKIKTLCVLGDFIAFDQPGLSTHDELLAEDGALTVASTLAGAERYINLMLNWFDNIQLIAGNHDERVEKATGGHLSLSNLLSKWGDKVNYSPYARMYLNTRRGTVAMYHQRNGGNNPINIARSVYEKESGFDGRKPIAVVTTHAHHYGSGKTKDGLAGVYGLGCMRDPQRTKYASMAGNTFAQWSQSFIRVQDGYLTNYELNETNWHEVLGDYADNASVCKRDK